MSVRPLSLQLAAQPLFAKHIKEKQLIAGPGLRSGLFNLVGADLQSAPNYLHHFTSLISYKLIIIPGLQSQTEAS